jgi:hypothetical protein
MTENAETSDLRRRISLAEQEIEGEKRVSRHILRKATENEAILFDIKKEVIDLKKEVNEVRNEITLLRADLPAIISNVVGALLREERERSR